MDEIWKDVEGLEGYYQVSNHGRIKSLSRKVRSRHGHRTIKETIVTPLFTKQGYLNVITSKNGVRGTLIVHQSVAKHFIGERPTGLVIDHIDGNQVNNRADNLRYVTTAENLRKRRDVKLDAEKVKSIRELLPNMSQSKIAKMFGVSQTMISHINLGTAWKDA